MQTNLRRLCNLGYMLLIVDVKQYFNCCLRRSGKQNVSIKLDSFNAVLMAICDNKLNDGISWSYFHGIKYSLKKVEMKIKRKL